LTESPETPKPAETAEPAQAPQPAPAPAPSPGDEATGGLRALAALLALALAFAAAVLIGLAFDTADTPTAAECEATPDVIPADGECLDSSSGQKSITVALLGLGGVFGAIGVIVCLLVATAGAGIRFMLPITGAAVLFGAAGVVVANV